MPTFTPAQIRQSTIIVLLLLATNLIGCYKYYKIDFIAEHQPPSKESSPKLKLSLEPGEMGSFMVRVEKSTAPVTIHWDKSYFQTIQGKVPAVHSDKEIEEVVPPLMGSECVDYPRQFRSDYKRFREQMHPWPPVAPPREPPAGDLDGADPLPDFFKQIVKKLPEQCRPSFPSAAVSTVVPGEEPVFKVYPRDRIYLDAHETCLKHKKIKYGALAKVFGRLSQVASVVACEKEWRRRGDRETWVVEELVDGHGQPVKDGAGEPIQRKRMVLPTACEIPKIRDHRYICDKSAVVGRWKTIWVYPVILYQKAKQRLFLTGFPVQAFKRWKHDKLELVLAVSDDSGTTRQERIKMRFDFTEISSDEATVLRSSHREREEAAAKSAVPAVPEDSGVDGPGWRTIRTEQFGGS